MVQIELKKEGITATVLEGITIETFPEAARRGQIQPGQRLAIVLDNDRQPSRPILRDVAARMRETALARGMTTEIFDTILAQD